MKLHNTFIIVFFAILVSSCTTQQEHQSYYQDFSFLDNCNAALDQAVINDYLNPPTASRAYAYPNLAAYEILRQDSASAYPTLSGIANGFTAIPEPGPEVDLTISAMLAFTNVAEGIVYSVEFLAAHREKELEKISATTDNSILEASKKYAESVSSHILDWANADGFKATKNMPEFTPADSAGAWRPTLPDYRAAMEPYFPTLRGFFIDSSAQFRCGAPPAYDLTEGSEFMRELKDVITFTEHDSTSEKLAIAQHWDCNPLVPLQHGHVMISDRKLTPGGHWMNITRKICRDRNSSPQKASYHACANRNGTCRRIYHLLGSKIPLQLYQTGYGHS